MPWGGSDLSFSLSFFGRAPLGAELSLVERSAVIEAKVARDVHT